MTKPGRGYFAEALALPITILETAGMDRANEPTTVGIPFPRGFLPRFQEVCLVDGQGMAVPHQTRILASWPDGSTKWLLLDFMASVPAGEAHTYYLRSGSAPRDLIMPADMDVRQEGQGLKVTGKCGVFEICPSPECFLRFHKPGAPEGEDSIDCSVTMTAASGGEYRPLPSSIKVETRGPIKTVLKIEGTMSGGDSQDFCVFICHLDIYQERPDAVIKFCIRNPKAALHKGGLWDLGDPASVYFKDLSVFSRIPAGESAVAWDTGDGSAPENQSEAVSRVLIYQDSSGGENWRSSNHIDGRDELPLSFRGYKVFQNGNETHSGLRAQPVLQLASEKAGVTCAIKKFWQNFPKALEATQRDVTIRLFPEQFAGLFELQGGEQKTHEVFVSFEGGRSALNRLKVWCAQPLMPQIAPEWYEESGAIRYLCISPWDEKGRLDAWISTVIEGPNSFFDRREIIDEYGWRNFGDCFADHEVFEQPEPIPLISHYNNQYDMVYSFLVQYMRCSDHRWFELAADLARHVIDIDIYHTSEDRYLYNGGMHWHTNHFFDAATATHRCFSKKHMLDHNLKVYGGGPSLDHIYTSGLLLFYYMTGDTDAKEAVLTLGNWVVRQVEGPALFLENLECLLREGLKRAKRQGKNANETYGLMDGPGRPSGNGLSALLDAFQISGDRSYLSKAEDIVRSCIHPDDDIRARNLSDVNSRWMYLVFLQGLAKFLDVKRDLGERDYAYSYAKMALLHYADWMASAEAPFLSNPEKLDFPNYATRAAQDFRKCNVLLLASQYAGEAQRVSFLKRAAFFFESSISYLESLNKTRLLARPLALMLLNGGVHAYFGKRSPKDAPLPGEDHVPSPSPSHFPVLCHLKRLARAVLHISPKREWVWLKRRLAEVQG